jgi:hypothetical protein
MTWQQILFGWPSAISCIALSALGLSLRRPGIVMESRPQLY